MKASLGWILLALLFVEVAAAQDSVAVSSDERSFREIDILPAISYTPETKLTLGVIGLYYMDFFRGDTITSLSNIQFLAI